MPTNEAVGLSHASVDDKLLGLLGPYHQHAIGMFNTCSRGPMSHPVLRPKPDARHMYAQDQVVIHTARM
jgi:hypothetical protein